MPLADSRDTADCPRLEGLPQARRTTPGELVFALPFGSVRLKEIITEPHFLLLFLLCCAGPLASGKPAACLLSLREHTQGITLSKHDSDKWRKSPVCRAGPQVLVREEPGSHPHREERTLRSMRDMLLQKGLWEHIPASEDRAGLANPGAQGCRTPNEWQGQLCS